MFPIDFLIYRRNGNVKNKEVEPGDNAGHMRIVGPKRLPEILAEYARYKQHQYICEQAEG